MTQWAPIRSASMSEWRPFWCGPWISGLWEDRHEWQSDPRQDFQFFNSHRPPWTHPRIICNTPGALSWLTFCESLGKYFLNWLFTHRIVSKGPGIGQGPLSVWEPIIVFQNGLQLYFCHLQEGCESWSLYIYNLTSFAK